MNSYKYILLYITLSCISLYSPMCWAQQPIATDSAACCINSCSQTTVQSFLLENGVPTTRHNSLKLLKSGREKFNDLFASIQQAKHHIHLEYFNFRNDSIGKALFTLLSEKVKEGVEVRAMFDAFGNGSNNRPLRNKHLKALRAQGIEIVKFDPFTFPYISHALHRDHRKIAIIDGKIGYTGGMNIADYYIKGLPEIGEWRDMQIRLEGQVVHKMQDIFLAMWNKETKQHVGGAAYYPSEHILQPQDVSIALADRVPHKTPKLIKQTYAKSIESAQDSVRIVNPYFVPTRSLYKAFKRALKKGANIQIMISSKSDVPFTPDAALYKAHRLMKRGAKVYLYNGGFHHTKVMTVDGKFCTVGTTNLNSRSLRYDYETNAFIFDREVTEHLNNIFTNDLAHCTELTPEYWRHRSAWKKFVGWFANLFTPFL